jgi:hypothetical protein
MELLVRIRELGLVVLGGMGLYLFIVILHFLLSHIRLEFAGWTLGDRMRRRITADLGRKAEEIDLSSFTTWMKVAEAEEKKGNFNSRMLVPMPIDNYVTLTDLTDLMDSSRREMAPLTLLDMPVRLFRIRYDSKATHGK